MNRIFDSEGTQKEVLGFDHFLSITDDVDLIKAYQVNLWSISLNMGVNKGIRDGYFNGDIIDLSDFIGSGKLILDELKKRDEVIYDEKKLVTINTEIFSRLKKVMMFPDVLINEINEKIW